MNNTRIIGFVDAQNAAKTKRNAHAVVKNSKVSEAHMCVCAEAVKGERGKGRERERDRRSP